MKQAWYKVELLNGEQFIGSPYLLPQCKMYDFWYFDYTTVKTRRIPVVEVKSMVEVA